MLFLEQEHNNRTSPKKSTSPLNLGRNHLSERQSELNPLEGSGGVVEAELRHPPFPPPLLPYPTVEETIAWAIFLIILILICPLLGGNLGFGLFLCLEGAISISMNWEWPIMMKQRKKQRKQGKKQRWGFSRVIARERWRVGEIGVLRGEWWRGL